MGLYDWLKRTMSGEEAGEVQFDAGEESFDGLNMKAVIEAHLGWRERLEKYVAGTSTEQLDPEVIGKNDQCALGKWINGSETKFLSDKEFTELRDAHDHFHRYAAMVVANHRDGNVKMANDVLNAEFKQFSARVQLKIVELYTKIHRRRNNL